jgi:hypothetical protein
VVFGVDGSAGESVGCETRIVSHVTGGQWLVSSQEQARVLELLFVLIVLMW